MEHQKVIKLLEDTRNEHQQMKHLILLKIQNMTDINVDLLQWFTNFLIKRLLMEQLKIKLCKI